jgi:response regulator NasT
VNSVRNIVIAFPKKEIATNIKKILAQSGYPVVAVCTTGAQALQSLNGLEDGVLICGVRFVDMMYEEIYEYLPSDFQMLLIASASAVLDREVDNLVCLSTPLKVHELLGTLEMMDYTITRNRRRMRAKGKTRSVEEREILDQAKGVLMERNSMTEEEAHRYIQKRSMDNGTGMVETAQMILSLMTNA